jgi:hypothetical protein
MRVKQGSPEPPRRAEGSAEAKKAGRVEESKTNTGRARRPAPDDGAPIRQNGELPVAAAFELSHSPLAVGRLNSANGVPQREPWPGLVAALSKIESQAGLEARLTELGFALDPEQGHSGRSRYIAGKLTLEVDARRRVADLAAITVRLHHGRDKVQEGVLIGGTMLEPKLFERLLARYEKTLDIFERAVERRGGAHLPANIDRLRAFLAAGRNRKERALVREHERELVAQLDRITKSLLEARAAGRAPRAIILCVDGLDASGKSSSGKRLLEALVRAGYRPRVEAFKAPSDTERERPWLERYDRGLPEEGEVVYWDRGPGGDFAYGKPNPERCEAMEQEFRDYVAAAEAHGDLFFSAVLFAQQEKQVATLGKRLGRRAIAARIEQILAAKDQLDETSKASLEAIRGSITRADFEALPQFDEVQPPFVGFAEHTGGEAIDTTRRHLARMELARRLERKIQQHAAWT